MESSRTRIWIGRVLTGLVVAFMLVDGIGKVLALAPHVEGTMRLGYGLDAVRPLGIVLTVSALLHVIPRMQIIGALLLTAYLGGATAAMVRVGTPFWFPVLMGILLWVGYLLRNPRVRALVMSPSAA